jgi:hypothetical protein
LVPGRRKFQKNNLASWVAVIFKFIGGSAPLCFVVICYSFFHDWGFLFFTGLDWVLCGDLLLLESTRIIHFVQIKVFFVVCQPSFMEKKASLARCRTFWKA